MIVRALALVLLVAACGGSQRGEPPPPPPPDAAPVAVFDEADAARTAAALLDVLARMAEIVERHAGDCPAIARELGALFDEVEPVFATARRAEEDPDAARLLTAAMAPHEAAVEPLVARISPGLAACREDAAVVAAMERMPVL